MRELLNGEPCKWCGKNDHHMEQIPPSHETHCISLPARGHTIPRYVRVKNIRGNEVLVRVAWIKDSHFRRLVADFMLFQGSIRHILRDETHDGEFPAGTLRPLMDAARLRYRLTQFEYDLIRLGHATLKPGALDGSLAQSGEYPTREGWIVSVSVDPMGFSAAYYDAVRATERALGTPKARADRERNRAHILNLLREPSSQPQRATA